MRTANTIGPFARAAAGEVPAESQLQVTAITTNDGRDRSDETVIDAMSTQNDHMHCYTERRVFCPKRGFDVASRSAPMRGTSPEGRRRNMDMSKALCTLLSSLVVVSAVACSSSESNEASRASTNDAPATIGSLESAIVTDAGVDAGDVDGGADAAP
jgi:hypothetical protein